MQGLLELADVPYVGSGVLGSAVAMDKVMAKTVLDADGIAQARWRRIRASTRRRRPRRRSGPSGCSTSSARTVFVKPANMGSSIGVTKATDAAELVDALSEAFAYDELVVVEEAVVAREIECARPRQRRTPGRRSSARSCPAPTSTTTTTSTPTARADRRPRRPRPT